MKERSDMNSMTKPLGPQTTSVVSAPATDRSELQTMQPNNDQPVAIGEESPQPMMAGIGNDLRFSIRTLTPIFTGDASMRQSPFLRESGLIGSLRFWMGALARGLGYDVPPASEAREMTRASDAGELDPVTRIFGCTGWRRSFSLKIEEPSPRMAYPLAHVDANNFGWDLHPGCWYAWDREIPIAIRQRPLPVLDYIRQCDLWMKMTWAFIDRLSGIGAHQAWGYGQIRLTEPFDFSDLEISALGSGAMTARDPKLPDLADFIFAEYQFNETTTLNLLPLATKPRFFRNAPFHPGPRFPALFAPIGLSLRYLLHFGKPGIYTASLNPWGTRFFGGTAQNDPAGRFHGSFLFRVNNEGIPDVNGSHLRFRVWAWLPKGSFSNWCRSAIQLFDELRNPGLWTGVAGCAPPNVKYFWPLTSVSHPPVAREIGGLSTILAQIERRSSTALGRTCIGSKNGDVR